MSKLPDNRIYYAQNREDLILEAFFLDVKKGFYVDVGACHPDVASVTKRFYIQGWRGINIEPQTNLYGLFARDRKRDINLNIGVGDKSGSLVLRSYTNNQGLSSVVSNVKEEHEAESGNKAENYEDVTIEVRTLKSILAEYKAKKIHFLKVDVEGYEYEVLEGNDWSRFRPEVICIEANHLVKDWRPMLLKNDYQQVFFDGLNEYYVDSKTNRAKKFNFVGHVVMDLKGGVAAEDYEAMSALACELESTKDSLALKTDELKSVKKLANRMVKLVPSRIKNKLTGKK